MKRSSPYGFDNEGFRYFDHVDYETPADNSAYFKYLKKDEVELLSDHTGDVQYVLERGSNG